MDDTSTKFHIPNHLKKSLRVLAVAGKAVPIMGLRMAVMKDVISKDGPVGKYKIRGFQQVKAKYTHSHTCVYIRTQYVSKGKCFWMEGFICLFCKKWSI